MFLKKHTVIFLALVVTASCHESRNYNPSANLTVPKQDEVLWKVIRYMARPPEGIGMEERISSSHDAHYREQQSLHRLDAYYIDDDSTHYFLVSRIAPSLTEKRVAIGGMLHLDKKGNLSDYEEVFRTWKMPPDTLAKRSIFLFDKMVNHENLESYYTSNSGNTDYIEFPDDRTYYDKSSRMWRTKL